MMIDAPLPTGDEVRDGHGDRVHHADQVDVDGVLEVQRLGVAHGHRQDAGPDRDHLP